MSESIRFGARRARAAARRSASGSGVDRPVASRSIRSSRRLRRSAGHPSGYRRKLPTLLLPRCREVYIRTSTSPGTPAGLLERAARLTITGRCSWRRGRARRPERTAIRSAVWLHVAKYTVLLTCPARPCPPSGSAGSTCGRGGGDGRGGQSSSSGHRPATGRRRRRQEDDAANHSATSSQRTSSSRPRASARRRSHRAVRAGRAR